MFLYLGVYSVIIIIQLIQVLYKNFNVMLLRDFPVYLKWLQSYKFGINEIFLYYQINKISKSGLAKKNCIILLLTWWGSEILFIKHNSINIKLLHCNNLEYACAIILLFYDFRSIVLYNWSTCSFLQYISFAVIRWWSLWSNSWKCIVIPHFPLFPIHPNSIIFQGSRFK